MLATEYKIPTYQGKVVAKLDQEGNYCFLECSEDDADNWVQSGDTFGLIPDFGFSLVLLSNIKFDDSSTVTESDCILVDDVPFDADLFFVLEPAFVRAV